MYQTGDENERSWSVYYELYIDVFFMVNFMMDYLVLMITRKMIRCSVPAWRVCLAAVAGAFLTCLIVVVPLNNTFMKFILFHGLVSVAMIKTGFGIRQWRELIRTWILIYVSGFLIGGVLLCVRQYVRIGSLFFVLAIVSYYVVSGIWSLISYLARRKQSRVKVILCNGKRQCQVEALIDTGNCLRDEITGGPVSIVDQKVIRVLYGKENLTKLRYIPYHSIGRSEGVMPLIRLDGMYVCQERRFWIAEPLVAVSEEDLTADDYQMILNPDILIGGIDYGDKSGSAASI